MRRRSPVRERPASEPRPPRFVAAALPVASTDASLLPAGILVLLAATFVFLLAAAAAALMPAHALPSRLSAVADRWREQLFFVALCALGCFATVLLVALASW